MNLTYLFYLISVHRVSLPYIIFSNLIELDFSLYLSTLNPNTIFGSITELKRVLPVLPYICFTLCLCFISVFTFDLFYLVFLPYVCFSLYPYLVSVLPCIFTLCLFYFVSLPCIYFTLYFYLFYLHLSVLPCVFTLYLFYLVSLLYICFL